jgi:hypothetical protein
LEETSQSDNVFTTPEVCSDRTGVTRARASGLDDVVAALKSSPETASAREPERVGELGVREMQGAALWRMTGCR